MLGGINRFAPSSSNTPLRPSSASSTSTPKHQSQEGPVAASVVSSRSSSSATNRTPTSTTSALPLASSQDVPAYVRDQSCQQSNDRDPPAHRSIPSTPSSMMRGYHRAPPSMPSPSTSSDRPSTQDEQDQAGPANYSRYRQRSMLTSSPNSPRLQPTYLSSRSLGNSAASSPSRIKVRDLSHIQSFANEEFLEQSERARRRGSLEVGRQYEISSMPVTDIIEMVAGLLTKITTTNDMQHRHLRRRFPPADGAANLSPQASSVLAFHGKNVPTITILSYLTRIHKYCPTTYEVFLSLLVYFDRMAALVNNRSKRQRLTSATSGSQQPPDRSSAMTPPSSSGTTGEDPKSPANEEEPDDYGNYFVVDSFNVHRLVIAGVTCASKFFSDVFYTNSRYAKVCTMPCRSTILEANN